MLSGIIALCMTIDHMAICSNCTEFISLAVTVKLFMSGSVVHRDVGLSLSVFFLPINILKFNLNEKCDDFSCNF